MIYLISSEGKCGRKSLPTKKHIKTQSSRALYNTNNNFKIIIQIKC